MQKYEEILRTKRQIIFYNFIGGISWGLGATIGVSILLTVIALLAQPLSLIPIFGDFIAGILEHVTNTVKGGS